MLDYAIAKRPQVVFGSGVYSQTGNRLKEFGAENVLIVSDAGVSKLGIVDKVCSVITEAGLKCAVFDKVLPEPADDFCMELAEQIKAKKYDAVVAVGGGSPIDTAKAATLIAGIPEEISDLHEYGGTGTKMKNSFKRVCTFFAMPTTSGTGAEVTQSAVLTSSLHGMKYSFMNPNMIPDLAIIDPDFTIGMPAGPTIMTGVDALTHAFENVLGIGTNDLTEIVVLECIRRIWKWLPVAVKDPQNKEARAQLSWAAHNAQANGGIANGHAVAHAIGATYHIVHGHACMLTLPTVIRHFAETSQEQIKKIAEVIGVEITGNAVQDATIVSDKVKEFYKGFGLKSIQEIFAEKEIADNREVFAKKLIPFIMDDFKSHLWNPPIHGEGYVNKVSAICYSIFDEK